MTGVAGSAGARLRALVAAHDPADAREAASKARFLAELDRLEHPCDEKADRVHVTASAVVAGPRGTVLHLHRRIGRWLQPGGHVEPGELPEDAARRETLEETGLVVRHAADPPELLHVDVHPAPRGHVHLDLRFLVVAQDADPVPAPGESPQARWFGWSEADAVADDSLAGALRAARRVWPTSEEGDHGA